MFSEYSKSFSLVKNSNLNEELGQVEYIFTDKTGTLTENLMEFKKCVIKGKVYENNSSLSLYQINSHTKCQFSDSKLLKDLNGPKGFEIIEFFEILALCNSVKIEPSEDEVIYQTTSIDEEALVIAAHCFGVSLIDTKPFLSALNINGKVYEYKILGINEFSFERRRMSVVVQPITDKSRPAMLLCKGADDVVIKKSKTDHLELSQLQSQLSEFSATGLRTLIIAKKVLSETQAFEYEKKYNLALNALTDKAKRLEDLAEEIENDLEIIGITGIQNKVKESVPNTITELQNAGIKI